MNPDNSQKTPSKKQLQGKYAKQWGAIAEKAASDLLITKGLTIREQNWSPNGGHKEIDIIAQKDNVIIFVEVKARSGNDQSPLDAIDKKKLNNIFRCAESFLNSISGDFWEYRFDIIGVVGTPESYSITHYEDVFLGPLRTYR